MIIVIRGLTQRPTHAKLSVNCGRDGSRDRRRQTPLAYQVVNRRREQELPVDCPMLA